MRPTTTGAPDPRPPLEDAPGRRGWYELEERQGALVRGRAVVLVVLAAAAAAGAGDIAVADRPAVVGLCLAALALHALLAWMAARTPRRLLLSVDAGLVLDALVIAALAAPSGGPASPALWLLPVAALAATLALGLGPGIKSLVLGALVLGGLAAIDGVGLRELLEDAGPLALAAATVAVAALLAPVNERELARRRDRLATLHAASLAFAQTADARELAGVAEEAARALLPGWEVRVRLDGAEVAERRWRADGRAVLELPVRGRGDDGAERALGAIRASRPVPRAGALTIRGDAVLACRALATALGAAAVQRELLQRLERLSLSDALTGLGNRRAFDRALDEEAARARRAAAPLGLVMLDVDHFKQFNDRHGHQAGDDALVAVARVMEAEARAEDRACRIGGEEFALLLPGAGATTAGVVAERIRGAIARDGPPDAAVTVSAGVAASDADDIDELLALADARLYAAKAAGRNRVIAPETRRPPSGGPRRG